MKLATRLTLLALAIMLPLATGCSFTSDLPLPVEIAPPTLSPAPSPSLSPADDVALAFLQAWERDDYPTMYSLLSPDSQSAYPEALFRSTYHQVTQEATIATKSTRILAAYQPDTHAQVSFAVDFQTDQIGGFSIENQMDLSVVQGRWGVDWSPAVIFPQLSDDTQVRMTTQIPSRGNIYDRSGLGLAVQGQIVEIGVVPDQMQDETAVLAQLGEVLGVDQAELRARYADVNPSWYVPLGRVSAEVGKRHYMNLSSTPGIELREAWERSYRPEVIAPHLVGIIGPIPLEEADLWHEQGYGRDEMVGWMGLERWGEPYLSGERGRRLEVISAQGGQIAVLADKPPAESSNLYTTFDREFQQQVQEILGQRTGAIAVLEAATGRVLALATYPTFDSNQVSGGISEQEWLQLEDDPRHPLLNRATQGAYPAGSVFKIITMASAMEDAGLSADSTFDCDGVWYGLGPELPKTCWLSSGHGQISLSQALTVSCDITFYQVGLLVNDLDPELLPDYARQFGLGSRTGIEVEENAGMVPDPVWKMQAKGEGWAPGDAVNLAIGQSELLVSPLQIAAALAAVGNGGTLYRPSLVESIAADPKKPDWTFEPTAVGQIPVSPENLAVIQKSLYKATSAAQGTAFEAFEGLEMEVAGKTGTAESGQNNPHAWFAGYAPAQSAEIAIAVIIEHAGMGGEEAAPLFRQVAEAYFENDSGPRP